MNIEKERARLERMTIGELRLAHAEVFGEETGARNKPYLVKRILWRMQANAQGGITERALARAKELADESALRTTAPRAATKSRTDAPAAAAVRVVSAKSLTPQSPLLPTVGACLRRTYKGHEIMVRVRLNGFEYEGELYRSLSAVTKAITGSHWNGNAFFGLRPKKACGLRGEG